MTSKSQTYIFFQKLSKDPTSSFNFLLTIQEHETIWLYQTISSISEYFTQQLINFIQQLHYFYQENYYMFLKNLYFSASSILLVNVSLMSSWIASYISLF